jgi:hypothetical protein
MICDIHTRLREFGELVLELFAAHLAGALGMRRPPVRRVHQRVAGDSEVWRGGPGAENLS